MRSEKIIRCNNKSRLSVIKILVTVLAIIVMCGNVSDKVHAQTEDVHASKTLVSKSFEEYNKFKQVSTKYKLLKWEITVTTPSEDDWNDLKYIEILDDPEIWQHHFLARRIEYEDGTLLYSDSGYNRGQSSNTGYFTDDGKKYFDTSLFEANNTQYPFDVNNGCLKLRLKKDNLCPDKDYTFVVYTRVTDDSKLSTRSFKNGVKVSTIYNDTTEIEEDVDAAWSGILKTTEKLGEVTDMPGVVNYTVTFNLGAYAKKLHTDNRTLYPNDMIVFFDEIKNGYLEYVPDSAILSCDMFQNEKYKIPYSEFTGNLEVSTDGGKTIFTYIMTDELMRLFDYTTGTFNYHGGEFSPILKVNYLAKLTDEEARELSLSEEKENNYSNEVKISYNGVVVGQDTNDILLTANEVLDKQHVYEGDEFKYTVEVNPDAVRFNNDASRLYAREIVGANFNFINDSIKVSDENGELEVGADNNQYEYKIEEDENGDNIISFDLPDGKALTITYTAVMDIDGYINNPSENVSDIFTLYNNDKETIISKLKDKIPFDEYIIVNAPTPKTLTYTGEAQELINKGSAQKNGTEYGTMKYAVTSSSVTSAPESGYLATIPEAKEAGSYKVWYYLDHNDNYDGTVIKSVDVTIKKAIPTYMKPDDKVISCKQTIDDIELEDGFSFTDSLDGLTIGENEVGVKYTPKDTTNYKVVEDKIKIIINDHVLIEEKANTPGCENAGNKAYWKCSVCGKHFSDEEGKTEIENDSWIVPAMRHDYGTPTYSWSEDGKNCTATVVCKREGCFGEGHTVTEEARVTGSVTTPSTCKDMGVTIYTAIFTNELFSTQTKEIKDVEKLNAHQPSEIVKEKEVKETCETAGSYDEVVYCQECGKELSRDTKTIPAMRHDYGTPTYSWSEDGKNCTATVVCKREGCTGIGHTVTEEAIVTGSVTTPSTCKEMGVTTYTATFTNELFTTQTKEVEDVEKLNTHQPSEIVKEKEVKETCEEAGSYDEVVYCQECGKELSRVTKTIPALKHDYVTPSYVWSEDGKNCTATVACKREGCSGIEHTVTEEARVTGSVTTPSTCKDMGVTTYTAIFKNELFTTQTKEIRNVEKINTHQPSEIVKEKVVKETCETAGSYDEVVYCTLCVKELSRETKTIPALKHDYGIPSYVWSEDGKSCTATAVCKREGCSGNGHTVTEEATVIGNVTTPSTCKDKGVTTYTATFTNELFDTQTKDVKDVEKLEEEEKPEEEVEKPEEEIEELEEKKPEEEIEEPEEEKKPEVEIEEPEEEKEAEIDIPSVEEQKKEEKPTEKPVAEEKQVEKPTEKLSEKEEKKPEKSKENPRKEDTVAPVSKPVENVQNPTSEAGEEIKGSKFVDTLVGVGKCTKHSIKLNWKKVEGADGYLIYGNQCNHNAHSYKNKYITKVGADKTTWTAKKLKKDKYYKFYIAAYKDVNDKKEIITKSKTVYATTLSKKYGVAKKVKINKKAVTLAVGETFKLKAKEVNNSRKIQVHRPICFESTDLSVATVDKKGKIKAISPGKCEIYVFAQNGKYTTCKITVE